MRARLILSMPPWHFSSSPSPSSAFPSLPDSTSSILSLTFILLPFSNFILKPHSHFLLSSLFHPHPHSLFICLCSFTALQFILRFIRVAHPFTSLAIITPPSPPPPPYASSHPKAFHCIPTLPSWFALPPSPSHFPSPSTPFFSPPSLPYSRPLPISSLFPIHLTCVLSLLSVSLKGHHPFFFFAGRKTSLKALVVLSPLV